MRVALISDLHANEAALRAVFADIDRTGADQVICLGDVAALGPRPREVLALLRERRCPVIMGNHDEFLLDPAMLAGYQEAPVIHQAHAWCRARLTDDDLGYVRTFERTRTVPLDGKTTLFLYHGSPRSHTEDILAEMPPGEIDRLIADAPGDVLAGGHTHIQMLRQHRGRLVVNPGSVGMPFREYVGGRQPVLLGHAEYATVEAAGGALSVTLRRVAVDSAAARAALSGSDHPMAPALLAQYK